MLLLISKKHYELFLSWWSLYNINNLLRTKSIIIESSKDSRAFVSKINIVYNIHVCSIPCTISGAWCKTIVIHSCTYRWLNVLYLEPSKHQLPENLKPERQKNITCSKRSLLLLFLSLKSRVFYFDMNEVVVLSYPQSYSFAAHLSVAYSITSLLS
jgi:hypothetical protein